MGAVTIDMVSADLSHEETILQIADALDTLDKVSFESNRSHASLMVIFIIAVGDPKMKFSFNAMNI